VVELHTHTSYMYVCISDCESDARAHVCTRA